MNGPTPERRDTARPQQAPMSLADSARTLVELNRQMVELNARLEYLHLILKLGVR
jgi:uncharacterized protein YjiS (DUF1127 family)